jgi:hypothetical protein
MATDLAEFFTLNREKGPRCTLESVSLKSEDTAKYRAALAEPAITTKAIATWLRERGIKVSPYTVQRHRRGDCRCGGGM